MEGAQERTKKELGTGRPGVERNGGGGGEKPKALFCVPPRSRRLDVGSEDRHGKNNSSEAIGAPALYSGYKPAGYKH